MCGAQLFAVGGADQQSGDCGQRAFARAWRTLQNQDLLQEVDSAHEHPEHLLKDKLVVRRQRLSNWAMNFRNIHQALSIRNKIAAIEFWIEAHELGAFHSIQ